MPTGIYVRTEEHKRKIGLAHMKLNLYLNRRK